MFQGILGKNKSYAVPVKIIKRATKFLVGTYSKQGKKFFLNARQFPNKTIEITNGKDFDIKPEDTVKAKITRYPDKDNHIKAKNNI